MNIKEKNDVGRMDVVELREYVTALHDYVGKLERRSRAHRQNIRSMQDKLHIDNLKVELAALQQKTKVVPAVEAASEVLTKV